MELNSRARAEIVRQKGLPFRNWVLGHQDWTGWLACGPQAVLATAGPRAVHVLNCRSVGWLRPDGQSVAVFAMRLRVPSNAALGVNTLAWHLRGSGWYSTDAVRVIVAS